MKALSCFAVPVVFRSIACVWCLRPAHPIRKESQVTFGSPILRRLVVAWLALLAFFALAAVMTARPAEAAPRPAVAVVQDDDDGGDDDSGARGDDDSGGRGDDDGGRGDDSGGVRDVPQGGIDTGAGGTTAGAEGQSGPGAVPYALAGGGLLVAAAVALLRRVTGGEGA
jgi:hypothetical protein